MRFHNFYVVYRKRFRIVFTVSLRRILLTVEFKFQELQSVIVSSLCEQVSVRPSSMWCRPTTYGVVLSQGDYTPTWGVPYTYHLSLSLHIHVCMCMYLNTCVCVFSRPFTPLARKRCVPSLFGIPYFCFSVDFWFSRGRCLWVNHVLSNFPP